MLEPTTISNLKSLISYYHLQIKKSRGQNFLIDQNLAKKLYSTLKLNKEEEILEIGGGFLSLTFPLIKTGYRLTTIEIDSTFSLWYQEVKNNFSNFNYLIADIRKVLNSPESFFPAQPPAIIIGNLPYYLTSHLLFLLLPQNWWKEAVFTLQKEVAERLVSPVGEKNRSPLTLMVEDYVSIKTIVDLPPQVFYPSPKISSRAIHLQKKLRGFNAPAKEAYLRKLIQIAFSKKRKTLINSLSMSISRLPKDLIISIVKNLNLNENIRAEDLSLDNFYCLSEKMMNDGISLS